MTSEQRPPVSSGHNFGVPRVVVVLGLTVMKLSSKYSSIWHQAEFLRPAINPHSRWVVPTNKSDVEVATRNYIWGRFHQTFSPSKKMPMYGVRQNICRLISPTRLMAEIIGQNLPNLCAIRRMPFAKKGVEFCAQKVHAKKCRWNWPLVVGTEMTSQKMLPPIRFGFSPLTTMSTVAVLSSAKVNRRLENR
jgi:hypothetical protein